METDISFLSPNIYVNEYFRDTYVLHTCTLLSSGYERNRVRAKYRYTHALTIVESTRRQCQF